FPLTCSINRHSTAAVECRFIEHIRQAALAAVECRFIEHVKDPSIILPISFRSLSHMCAFPLHALSSLHNTALHIFITGLRGILYGGKRTGAFGWLPGAQAAIVALCVSGCLACCCRCALAGIAAAKE